MADRGIAHAPSDTGWDMHDLILFLVVLAATGALYWRFVDYPYDDAFIHARIARNLAETGRPYFRIDQRVMGDSSMVWTLLLGLIFKTFGPHIQLICPLEALLTAGTAVLSARLLAAWGGARTLLGDLAGAFVAVSTLLFSAAGLMETPLAALALTWAAWLYLRRRPWSFAVWGSSIFIRPELALLALLFLAHDFWRRVVPWHFALGLFVAGLLPLGLAEILWFGTLVPHAVVAKSIVYAPHLVDSLSLALPGLFPGILGKALRLGLLIAVATTCAAWATRSRAIADEVAALLAVGGVGILGAYLATRAMVFSWYQPLFLMPVLLPAAALGLHRRAVTGALAALTLWPNASALGRTCYAAVVDRAEYPGFVLGARVRTYLSLAGELNAQYPGASLMSAEIGALGWAYRGPIYDAEGLVDDGALPFHPLRVPEERSSGLIGAIPPAYVAQVRPDLIVSYPLFMDALSRSLVAQDYRLIRESALLPEDQEISRGQRVFGSSSLNVLVRRDLAIPPP